MPVQGDNEACTDVYQGAAFVWTHISTQRTNTVVSYDGQQNDEKHAFQLRVLRRHRRLVQQYLTHVSLEAAAEERRNRQLLVGLQQLLSPPQLTSARRKRTRHMFSCAQ